MPCSERSANDKNIYDDKDAGTKTKQFYEWTLHAKLLRTILHRHSGENCNDQQQKLERIRSDVKLT